MKTLIIITLALVALSCGPSKKLPAAPSPTAYYDTAELKLVREHHRLKAEIKQGRKFISKENAAILGGTLFGVYCILAWRYDIE